MYTSDDIPLQWGLCGNDQVQVRIAVEQACSLLLWIGQQCLWVTTGTKYICTDRHMPSRNRQSTNFQKMYLCEISTFTFSFEVDIFIKHWWYEGNWIERKRVISLCAIIEWLGKEVVSYFSQVKKIDLCNEATYT